MLLIQRRIPAASPLPRLPGQPMPVSGSGSALLNPVCTMTMSASASDSGDPVPDRRPRPPPWRSGPRPRQAARARPLRAAVQVRPAGFGQRVTDHRDVDQLRLRRSWSTRSWRARSGRQMSRPGHRSRPRAAPPGPVTAKVPRGFNMMVSPFAIVDAIGSPRGIAAVIKGSTPMGAPGVLKVSPYSRPGDSTGEHGRKGPCQHVRISPRLGHASACLMESSDASADVAHGSPPWSPVRAEPVQPGARSRSAST